MRELTAEEIRAAVSKRRAPDTERKKEKKAVGKRPRASGPSVGAPAAAARAANPRVTFVPPRDAASGDREASASGPPAKMPASSSGPAPPLDRAGEAAASVPGPTVPSAGARATPSASSGPRASGGSSARSVGPASPRRRESAWEEVDGKYVYRARASLTASGLHDRVVARGLTEGMLLPRDEAELAGETLTDLVDSSFPAFVKLAHGMTTMRGLLLRYAETSRNNSRRLKAAEASLSRAEHERSEAAKGEAKAKEELARLKERTASQLSDKDAALQKERVLSAQAAEKLDFSESEHRLAISRSLAHEERAKATVERATASEARARTAEEATAEAENRAAEAERLAARAVEEYKESDAFAADAAMAGVKVYSVGFYDCRSQVAERFPDLDLRQILMPGDSDESEEGGREDDGGDDGDDVVEVTAPTAPEAPGSEAAPSPSDPMIAPTAASPEVPDVQTGAEAASGE